VLGRGNASGQVLGETGGLGTTIRVERPLNRILLPSDFFTGVAARGGLNRLDSPFALEVRSPFSTKPSPMTIIETINATYFPPTFFNKMFRA
jgi:hypothetical protein